MNRNRLAIGTAQIVDCMTPGLILDQRQRCTRACGTAGDWRQRSDIVWDLSLQIFCEQSTLGFREDCHVTRHWFSLCPSRTEFESFRGDSLLSTTWPH